jgi:hypothetical protein
VLFSRNIGLSPVVIILYTLTSLCNSSLVLSFLSVIEGLRPEQTGALLFSYGALPMFVLVLIAIYLLRHFDARAVVVLGLSAFAAVNLWGTQLSYAWAREDFAGIMLLASVGQAFSLLPIIIMALSNSDSVRATSFAADIQIMRLGGAEIGIAVTGTWLRVREQIHSNYLGQHIETAAATSPSCCRSSRISLPVTAQGPRRHGRWGRCRRRWRVRPIRWLISTVSGCVSGSPWRRWASPRCLPAHRRARSRSRRSTLPRACCASAASPCRNGGATAINAPPFPV